MGLPELCIRRPVFASVLSLLVLLIGIVAYDRLTLREYPDIDRPTVSVTTRYPGASAEIIESQVTQVLEASIAGIDGLDILSSSSRAESSRITANFVLGTDPDVAASEVRDRVSRVRGRLANEVSEPVIAKVEADADAILYIAFTSQVMSPLEITDFVERHVRTRLQTVPGVADVQILGQRRWAMRLWLDRDRLAAYGLTVQDIESALREQNVEVPGGRIESVDREFTVLARTDLQKPAQFEAIVVKDADGFPVYLGDVGRAELGAADTRRAVSFNGRNSVSIGIVKQATANPLDVTTAVRAILPEVQGNLPAGLEAVIANDTTVFIDRSIKAVFVTIGEAVLLVTLVVLVFLGSLRATLIPVVTIPISLIGTFALMWAFGFSINTLTLLALVLAIGLVVDDAIVVLENVHRHIEKGLKPLQAAITGSREITFAIIAMTLTLAAVFAPIAMTPGRTGRLFIEFALALAGAVLISGFVALTLTPMMCSKLLRPHSAEGRIARLVERGLSGMDRGYRRLLEPVLRRPWVILPVWLIVAGGSGVLFQGLPRELAPLEDRGYVRVGVRGPEGATIDYTMRNMAEVESVIAAVPEIDSRFMIAGVPEVTRGIAVLRLVPWEQRERAQHEITASLRGPLGRIPGVVAVPTNPPSLGQDGRAPPVQIVVQTTGSYAELAEYVDTLTRALEAYPGITDLDNDLSLTTPQLDVSFDRAKIADVGVGIDTVGRTLESFLAGRQVTRFNRDAEQYDVILQLEDRDRREPEDLDAIYVRGRGGEMIQLSNLVTVSETVAARELNRFNQLRSSRLSGGLAPGYALGEVLDHVEATAREVLPPTVRLDFTGPSREFRQSSASLAFIFGLALAFIYLLLSAQFESFRAPLVIMLTVPLSMAGALAALHLTGATLNVYSQIGLVTLVGLITKHGILIVEFTNQLRARGEPVVAAVREAAVLRLRPILMTTGAMVLGAVPLALATGAGAESRQQIGWVIVGGMSVGTLLTLFVVPAACLLEARLFRRRRPAQERGPALQPAE
ncbi:MAG TPA: efflux RND transporter permease subunit [Geminicoccaceae bacterium]|nr:efflux RND transporter permease subunit [Geminicoccaceae bacterium]